MQGWIKRFNQAGINGVTYRRKSGRPRLMEAQGLDITYCTLGRYLHEQDYARRIPRPMPEPPVCDHRLKQHEASIPKLVELLNDDQVEIFFRR